MLTCDKINRALPSFRLIHYAEGRLASRFYFTFIFIMV